MSDSLRPHGLWPTRLLCPWDSPGKIWSRLPCPPPGELPDSGMETVSLASPALAGVFFTPSASWEAQTYYNKYYIADCVSWVPKLTLLDFQIGLKMCSWSERNLFVCRELSLLVLSPGGLISACPASQVILRSFSLSGHPPSPTL